MNQRTKLGEPNGLNCWPRRLQFDSMHYKLASVTVDAADRG